MFLLCDTKLLQTLVYTFLCQRELPFLLVSHPGIRRLPQFHFFCGGVNTWPVFLFAVIRLGEKQDLSGLAVPFSTEKRWTPASGFLATIVDEEKSIQTFCSLMIFFGQKLGCTAVILALGQEDHFEFKASLGYSVMLCHTHTQPKTKRSTRGFIRWRRLPPPGNRSSILRPHLVEGESWLPLDFLLATSMCIYT